MTLAYPEIVHRLLNSVGEIIAHCIITIFFLAAMRVTEWVFAGLGMTDTLIPYTSIKIRDWMMLMEVGAATIINLVGLFEAVKAYSKR